MLVEKVPALYDATATYPMEGIAVKPFQQDIAVPVTVTFAGRSARFDGASSYKSNTITVPASDRGTFSTWFRNNEATWNASTARIFQFRVGSVAVLELLTSNANRNALRINNDTALDSNPFGPASVTATTTLNRRRSPMSWAYCIPLR